jgi:hypothetical protein
MADACEIEMLATAHDAVLIQAPADPITQEVAIMTDCMQRAGAVLTNGFLLRVSHEIKQVGERFIEDRGKRTLAVVDRFLSEELHAA